MAITLYHASPHKISAGQFIVNKRKLNGKKYAYFAPSLYDAYFWASWLSDVPKEKYFFHEVKIDLAEKIIVAEGGYYASFGGGVEMRAADLIDLQNDLREESEILIDKPLKVFAVEPFCPKIWAETKKWLDEKWYVEMHINSKKRVNVPYFWGKLKGGRR